MVHSSLEATDENWLALDADHSVAEQLLCTVPHFWVVWGPTGHNWRQIGFV